MSCQKLYKFSAHQLREKLNSREIKSEDILLSLSERIRETESKVKAYVRLNGQNLKFSSQTPAKTDGLLNGIPISIKDNICTEGMPTECCSKILQGFNPPYDATVIRKLKEAGALILETKLNMDEFAFGSSTENSFFGVTHNPWNLACVPGGSSGGSAAAVAADEAIAALGSDTGGSIRQPASFCGVVGLKPTYGRVSRYGLIAFASSLDQIGPLTKDVRDCALVMNVISGYDPMDSTSVNMAVPDYTASLGKDIRGMKFAIPKEYFVEGMDPEIKNIFSEALEQIKKLGATYQEVSLPNTKYAVPVYYIVATAEASSNLSRFDGVQYGLRIGDRGQVAGDRGQSAENRLIDMYNKTRGEGFGEEAKRRIILGTFSLSHGYYDAYYLRALKVRTLIKNDFDAVFKDFDAILAPVSPTAAFKIGEKASDPLKMYLSDIYTISANLAGIPAISVPGGFTKGKLPVGLQILAKPFAEEVIFQVASAYEQATPWYNEEPKL